MNNKVVLAIGAVLIAIGIFKPDFSQLIPKGGDPVVDNPVVEIEEPSDPDLKEQALVVAEILKGGGNNRKADATTLSKLYSDIAMIISLDEENEIVKTTNEIREVNSVAGTLMNLQLKGEYKGLPEAAKGILVSVLGDDVAVLNEDNRQKAVDAFEALSWGCYMGAK